MIKCVYNGLKLGHNLVKKSKSSSVTGVTGGAGTPKDKARVLSPSPSSILHCLNAKTEDRTFNETEIIYLKDNIISNCSFGPFYRTDSCFGNNLGHLSRGPLRSSVEIHFH